MVAESDIFGGDGCDGTDTLGPDVVSETNLIAGAEWGRTTVDCGVNYNGDVGIGEGGVSGASLACGAGIVRLIIFAICFIDFCVSSPNESEGTVGLGSDKRAIIYPIYCQI